MNLDAFLEEAWLPLIATAVLIFFGLRAYYSHDLTFIRRKDAPKLKDEKMYAESAGKLMLFLGLISFLSAVAGYYFGPFVSLGVFMAGMIVFMILWVKMDRKYGEKRL